MAKDWFGAQGWRVFPFQQRAWESFANGGQGIVNAPTGSGKTYSLMIPILLTINPSEGLQAIWVTPIRALSKEILQSAKRAAEALNPDVTIAIRTGDTSNADKQRLKKKPPNILITTPESIHVLLSQKHYDKLFANLMAVVVDEWHDLIGSKRGVQIELALSRFRGLCPALQVWGISATIGNLEQALEVLMGSAYQPSQQLVIRSEIKKRYEIEAVFPDELNELPWAGHLGIQLLDKIIPILLRSESTLIFLNTRGQAEIWYQKLLERHPDFAGAVALHHGSMSRETRHWVEDALHEGRLKTVICTSSLDLGVDFRPVETIIQVGSPKGVARFIQRAGRSGHQPGATSKIYFLPTHSLELIEAAALREAINNGIIESREPHVRSFDVLIQYLVTLAVSNGFREQQIFEEIKQSHCFQSITLEEWHWCLQFIVSGGDSLGSYDEFHKVVVEDGVYKVTSRKVAMRHRLSIGTIVSDVMMKVKFHRGGFIGHVAEYFISRLNPGDNFWFSGQSLELYRVRGLTAEVKRSDKKRGPIPSWQGGRMPLSSQLSKMLRQKLNEAAAGNSDEVEIQFLRPLMARQQLESTVPRDDQFLIELFETDLGHHALFYPFEGRFVHEGMGALMAYRLSKIKPITFSIAMNDYGFELLSDQPIPIEEGLEEDLFNTTTLLDDIYASINSVEMGRRQFRDIASISGLVFNGYPGKQKKQSHLQASSQLFFDVFNDYDPQNLLLRQAFDEVTYYQLEERRLRLALERIQDQEVAIYRPKNFTPLSFPIVVDRARETLSSEKLSDRIKRMNVF